MTVMLMVSCVVIKLRYICMYACVYTLNLTSYVYTVAVGVAVGVAVVSNGICSTHGCHYRLSHVSP